MLIAKVWKNPGFMFKGKSVRVDLGCVWIKNLIKKKKTKIKMVDDPLTVLFVFLYIHFFLRK